MLAIVTGTICPSGDMKQLKLRNTEERLKQYVDALGFLIEEAAFTKIVFCENSGFDMGQLKSLEELASSKHVALELLSFCGNTELCCKYGKGFGEGEIMKYVFENSRLIQDEAFYVKITGRLKIVNIKDICKRLKPDRCYFNIPNRTIREYYDTKLYAMPTHLFRNYFADSYVQVRDDEGKYLEVVYTDILLKGGIKVQNFPRFPRVVGISGSSGLVYSYTEWKCIIKDVLSYLGYYKVK